MVTGLVPSMLDVSDGHFDDKVKCKGNCHSPREWRCLVSYPVAQSRIGGHSDMMVGLVLTGSDVSACLFKHAYGLVPCMCQM